MSGGIPTRVEDFAQYLAQFQESCGFADISQTLRLEASGADGETVSMRMPLRDEVAQPNGMYAAAALFGLADITGTFLAMQAYAGSGQFPLAVQSSQNYLSNSKAEHAVATARLLRGGSSVCVVEVHVRDTTEKLLMHATFTYVIKERPLGR